MFKRNWRSRTSPALTGQRLINRIAGTLICMVLCLALIGCTQQPKGLSINNALRSVSGGVDRDIKVEEVSPPKVIQELRSTLDRYHPKVKILGPKPDTVLEETTLTVQFDVDDFPLFKDPELALGPHLHVFLDDRPYQALYDASQSLTFKDLSPGTHTIRAFASRPWHESFKTPGAYDQLTFHVFAPTQANHPDPDQVLLTYSRPEGSYGAEPIMVDYYLSPSVTANSLPPQKVRVSLNGQSFTTDEWTPLYLKGFKPGSNWVKVELLDENGKLANNVYSETLRLIQFNPKSQDALARLVRGDLTAKEAERIVDLKVSQRLEAQKRETKATPEPTLTPKPTLTPSLPVPEVSPSPVASPMATPMPAAIAPAVIAPNPSKPLSLPIVTASPTVKPKPLVVQPTPTPTPKPLVPPSPVSKQSSETVKIPVPSAPKSDLSSAKPKPKSEPSFWSNWSKFNPKQFIEEKTSQGMRQVQTTTAPETTVPSVSVPGPSAVEQSVLTKIPAIAKPEPTKSPDLGRNTRSPLPSPSPSIPQTLVEKPPVEKPPVEKPPVEKMPIDWREFLKFKSTGNTEKLPMVQPTEGPVLPKQYLRTPEPLSSPSASKTEAFPLP